jgi:membrane-associated phospholipid phosphatase
MKELLFIFFFCSTSFCYAQNWDIRTLRSINSNGTQQKDKFFHTLEKTSPFFDLGAPATVLILGVANKDKAMQRKGWVILGAFAANGIATYGLKNIIKRERPFNTYPDIIQRNSATSYSMPSGHTSAAFSIATATTLAFPKWYIAVPMYGYASLVGYSRLYEGVHYPTDVIAGAALGTGTAYLTHLLNKKLQRSKNRSK